MRGQKLHRQDTRKESLIPPGFHIVRLPATVDRYVKEHPEEWHQDAPAFVYSSLGHVCRK
jgi:hypothetical protein